MALDAVHGLLHSIQTARGIGAGELNFDPESEDYMGEKLPART
jgi:hypothetical protein